MSDLCLIFVDVFMGMPHQNLTFSFVIFICLLEQRSFCISFFEMASARSYKIGVVGNIWLVDNTVFSERALRTFLIFYMKLGHYKGRKVTKLDF